MEASGLRGHFGSRVFPLTWSILLGALVVLSRTEICLGKTFAWKPAKRTVFRNSQWGDVSNIVPKELRGMKRQTPQKAKTVIFTWKNYLHAYSFDYSHAFYNGNVGGTGVGIFFQCPLQKRVLFVFRRRLIFLSDFAQILWYVKFDNYEKRKGLLEWNVPIFSTKSHRIQAVEILKLWILLYINEISIGWLILKHSTARIW